MVKQVLGVDDLSDAKRYNLTNKDWEVIDDMLEKNTIIGSGIMDALKI